MNQSVLTYSQIEESTASTTLELKVLRQGTLNLEQLKEFTQELKHFSSLKKLTLDVNRNSYVEGYATELFAGLSTLKQLVELDLTLKFNFFYEQGTKELGIALSSCSHITSLTLNLERSSIQAEFSSIIEGLSKLTGLKQLNLNLSDNSLSTEITQLGRLISSFHNLQQLKLSLENNSIQPEGLKQFGEKLSINNNLTDLSLNFNSNSKIDDISMTYFSESLLKYKQLQSLALQFTSTGVSNSGSLSLVKHLNELGNLTHLILVLSNLDEEGALAISTALSEVKKLTHLNLDVSNTQIKDQGLGSLSKIGAHKTLQSLDLQVNYNRLSDQGIINFSSQFEPLSLKHFFISFKTPNDINDEGLISLGECITKSHTIESFGLNVSGSNIKLEGIQKFSQNLLKMKQLKNIDFDFGYCEFYQEGCYELITNLSKLENLESLRISIEKTRIGDQGLALLGPLFAKYPKLKDLKLLAGHNQLYCTTISTFLNALSEMPHPPKIYFEFGYNSFDPAFREEIKAAAAKLSFTTDMEEL